MQIFILGYQFIYKVGYQPGPKRLGRRDKMASFAEFPYSTTEQMNLNNSHMIPLASVDRYPAV